MPFFKKKKKLVIKDVKELIMLAKSLGRPLSFEQALKIWNKIAS